jgi:hypothetical protein
MKYITSVLIVGLASLTASVQAGGYGAAPMAPYSPPTGAPSEPLFGPGLHIGAHALFLTPDADQADDTWGGGVNLDYFFNSNVGIQLSGSWADPGTDEIWHNYVADLVLRAPIEVAYIAPYVFAGGGAIVEDSWELLGRAGVGIEFRPVSSFGIFADWGYNFPGGGGGDDDIEDYQMIRMGVKFGF